MQRGRELLGAGATEALDAGAAPLLLRAFDGPVAQAVVAERAPAYVTTLFGMLLLRRDHEVEPLHEDIERFVAPGSQALDPGWSDQTFARDLDQLIEWGCLERRAEPLKIRGYKDIRRERYRYRLTDDAVALLEWLEGRLAARIEGRMQDSRDLLKDMLGTAKELVRVVKKWHQGEHGDEDPRRAIHLLVSIDDRAHAIGEELIAFRAGMIAFASRPYDLPALRALLGWLERYVRDYLARIESLRGEFMARIDELSAPRLRRALLELYALAVKERSETPSAFRATGVLRDPIDTLDAQRAFFAERGRLATLCTRIDESARAVLRKMHRHLREIERRSARLEDLRTRIDEIATLPADEPDVRLAVFANALVSSAHVRFGTRRMPDGGRLVPPLPRRHTAPAERNPSRPIRPKQLPPDAARALRARRLAELAAWLAQEVLRGGARIRISEFALEADEAPRRWLDVARARHLDHGRDLVALAVSLVDAPGEARLGRAGRGLVAPDCVVSAVADRGRKQVPR